MKILALDRAKEIKILLIKQDIVLRTDPKLMADIIHLVTDIQPIDYCGPT